MGFPNIATKSGDGGTTALWCGTRVPKTDPRIRANAAIDLALSALGRCHVHLEAGDSTCRELSEALFALQKRMIALMGEIATSEEHKQRFVEKRDAISSEDLATVEGHYERTREALNARGEAAMKWRIYGQGGPAAAELYYARACFREAELAVCGLHESGFTIRDVLLQVLNRSSDLLFCVAVYLEK